MCANESLSMRIPTACAEAIDARDIQAIEIRASTRDDRTMWARIRKKMLDAKARAEKSPANWSGIAYDPNPPLLEDELETVESELGVRLPDDYRRFLMTIGDGGVGPGYGLLPLRTGIQERGECIYGLDEPYEPPHDTRECQELQMPGMHLITYDGCAYYTGLVVSGPATGSVWSYVEVSPGWVPAMRDYVGPDGQPFEMSGNDLAAYAAMYDARLLPDNESRRMGFVDWYEDWLDSLLASVR